MIIISKVKIYKKWVLYQICIKCLVLADPYYFPYNTLTWIKPYIFEGTSYLAGLKILQAVLLPYHVFWIIDDSPNRDANELFM